MLISEYKSITWSSFKSIQSSNAFLFLCSKTIISWLACSRPENADAPKNELTTSSPGQAITAPDISRHLTTSAPQHPHPVALRTLRANTMASRRLALNLQTAVRSKAAINAVKARNLSPLTRGLATPVSYGSKTESTTLKNGFTVCSQ
jgi:hypothetical protein